MNYDRKFCHLLRAGIEDAQPAPGNPARGSAPFSQRLSCTESARADVTNEFGVVSLRVAEGEGSVNLVV
jgi:hypothetical protein